MGSNIVTATHAPVIDGHGHIMEPVDLWTNYIDPKYRDRALRFARSPEGIDYMVVDNKPSPYSYGVAPFVGGIGIPYERLAMAGAIHYEDGPKAASDPPMRLQYLDAEGIDISLIYPSCGLIWGAELKDVALSDAYTRAYNNWAFDFCSGSDGRLVPLAFLPVLDIEVAIAEIRRTARQGAKGYVMFATPLTTFGFWSGQYDRLWAEIEASGLPIVFHPALNERFFGCQWANESVGITDDRYLLYLETCSVVVDIQGALAQLFQGGVLDRFPRLKVVMLEIGAGWIWPFLERSDVKYKRVGAASPLKLLPSEYFSRQMWVGVEPHESMIPDLVARFGADRFLWGTDFPHWDNPPETLRDVCGRIEGLNSSEQQDILGNNARRAFCLG